jgi:hypothetical protein
MVTVEQMMNHVSGGSPRPNQTAGCFSWKPSAVILSRRCQAENNRRDRSSSCSAQAFVFGDVGDVALAIGILVDDQSVLGHMHGSLWQLDMLHVFKVAGRRQPEPFDFAAIHFIFDRFVYAVRWQ